MKNIIDQTTSDIASIKIQGATNVARATAEAIATYSLVVKAKKPAEFVLAIKKAGERLLSARITEPMADNAIEFINYYLKKNSDLTVEELRRIAVDAAAYFLALIKQNDLKISQFGQKLIKSGQKFMTHCHASTVINIFKSAHKVGKKFSVFQTETRPLYQGHRTARDLMQAGIKDILIIDSAASFYLSKLSGLEYGADKIIIGCDAIARDGSCVNKIGSFGIAMTAKTLGIPVYVATQALKINEDAKNLQVIKLEERSAKEVWSEAPKGLTILNPAFDRIPADLITGYICEFGVVKPKEMIKLVKKNYPWLW